MDRERFYHPPQALEFHDASGRFTPWPHVHTTRLVDPATFRYEWDPAGATPLRLFVKGTPYRLLGFLPADRHLYGADPPARIYLLGTDPSGRDVLSRLLYGAQISLTVGLVGIAISFTIGLLLGGISGYFGGWVDTIIMRGSELLLSIPGLYLLIALRGIFPVDLPSQQVYLGIVVILAFIGWAGLARVIRGMVLSIRKAEYVAAAEALGMSRLRVIARHILPNTMSFVIVAATVTIPGYILGEVVLSFLGLGVQEPAASWGNMLAAARSVRVLTSFPWMLFAPGIAIFLTVMAFNFLGDGLRDALDPRRVLGGKGA
jgi:peptide/nickel transport system permease protein